MVSVLTNAQECAGRVVKLDAANGVAAEKVALLNNFLRGLLVIDLYNDGNQGKLNYMVGILPINIYDREYSLEYVVIVF